MLAVSGPRGFTFYPPPDPYSRFGHPRGGSRNPSKFSPVSNTSLNLQNMPQGFQMSSKMTPKSIQNITFDQKRQCVSRTVNTMLFFTCVTPKCDQNRQKLHPVTCTVSLVSQILKMSVKWHQMGSQKAPKIHPKSVKISMWTPVCPMGCPATRKYAPRVPKWGPKAPQMTHLGTQKYTFGYPNWVVHPPILQVISPPVAEGAGGRGEAFRYIYIPM